MSETPQERPINRMPISEDLERRLGKRFQRQYQDPAVRQEIMQCPPVSAQLIAHLRLMFSDPGKEAHPTNPLLPQLLTIQYGCEKVLDYLERHHNMQSGKAREDLGV